MRTIVGILLTAAVGTIFQTVRAQSVGPIRHPNEHLAVGPTMPQASCTEYSGLPEPMFEVDWRVFPPPGLLEERPERLGPGGRRWELGVGSDSDDLLGPRHFTYDQSGRVATWTVTFGPVEDPSENVVKTSYAYGASGNLTEVLVEEGDSTSLVNDNRWLYRYDLEGRNIGAEYQEWRETWVTYILTACSYDDSGRLELRVDTSCRPPTPEVPVPECQDTDSTLYEYDSSDRITRETRQHWVPNAWLRPQSIQYTYDELGRLVGKIDTDIRTRFEWTYDEQGRLAEEVRSVLFDRVRTRYDYQYAGLLTRIATDTWIASLEAYSEVGEVRYDYGPLLDLRSERRFVGPAIMWSGRSYRYNERGDLTHAAVEAWNNTGWRDQQAFDYTYHAAGFLEEFLATSYVYGNGPVFEIKERVRYGYAVGTSSSDRSEAPVQHVLLEQSYPNPSSRETAISYSLSQPSDVDLYVFDLMGRKIGVVDRGFRPAGRHSVTFSTGNLPSGVYFYRLEAGCFEETRRMVVVR